MNVYFDASANCFLNAFLREVSVWRFESVTRHSETHEQNRVTTCGEFVIETEQGTVRILCQQYSHSGRHKLLMPAQWTASVTDASTASATDSKPMAFMALSQWLLNHPLIIKMSSLDNREALLARVKDSDNNIRHAVAHNQEQLTHLMQDDVAFIESEGSLFTGHSIHPCPKARDAFSIEDAKHYAPEYGQQFALHWFALHKRHVFINLDARLNYTQVVTDLAQNDARLTHWLSELAEDYVLVPCHPFQLSVWQQHAWLQRLTAQGQCSYLGSSEHLWRATSSLRAIHNPQLPWMLKFSLSLKLTNSVRHLQPEELKRGVELCRVLNSPNAQPIRQQMQPMTILMEPVAIAIKDEHGDPIPECMALWRDNPFTHGQDKQTEMLAALLQDDPTDGIPRLAKRLQQHGVTGIEQVSSWFEQFLRVCIQPLLLAQSNFGLLFGAHQQNLLLRFDGVMPVAAYFRDCQGTGFTPLAKTWLGDDMDDLGAESENLIDQEAGMSLFIYYLFINSTFNTISSLCALAGIEEKALLAVYQNWLQALRETVVDTACIDTLLNSPTLNAKGNFLCSIQNINENTSENPLALYHPFANPLTQLNPVDTAYEHSPKAAQTTAADKPQSLAV